MLLDKVTICLTSCGRWELLWKTVESLMLQWDGSPPHAFYINDDSGTNPPDEDYFWGFEVMCLNYLGVKPYWLFSNRNGQVYAIDALYELVETEYIFHCEDDWEFTSTGFVAQSLAVLKHDPAVACVWLRYPNDRNGHPANNRVMQTNDGIKYQWMACNYRRIWHGMTWNPGMRKLNHYQYVGKFSDFCNWDFKDQCQAEADYNNVYYKNGFRGATLMQGYIRHTGEKESIKLLKQ